MTTFITLERQCKLGTSSLGGHCETVSHSSPFGSFKFFKVRVPATWAIIISMFHKYYSDCNPCASPPKPLASSLLMVQRIFFIQSLELHVNLNHVSSIFTFGFLCGLLISAPKHSFSEMWTLCGLRVGKNQHFN